MQGYADVMNAHTRATVQQKPVDAREVARTKLQQARRDRARKSAPSRYLQVALLLLEAGADASISSPRMAGALQCVCCTFKQ